MIRPRNQTLGPKIDLELLGWLRPVRARKADRIVRFLPSLPTCKSFSFISDSEARNSRKGDSVGCVLAFSRASPVCFFSRRPGERLLLVSGTLFHWRAHSGHAQGSQRVFLVAGCPSSHFAIRASRSIQSLVRSSAKAPAKCKAVTHQMQGCDPNATAATKVGGLFLKHLHKDDFLHQSL